MPYDCLDSSVELPAALVGSVVECRPIQRADSLGILRTTWQILSIRSDKNTPDREDAATACLQNAITAPRLLMLFHQFSQPQPEVFAPPAITQPMSMDPSGHYGSSLGVPIYVGPQLPQSMMAMGPPGAYQGSLPLPSLSRPREMLPLAPHPPRYTPGPLMGHPFMEHSPGVLPGPHVGYPAHACAYPGPRPLDAPAPGILSGLPVPPMAARGLAPGMMPGLGPLHPLGMPPATAPGMHLPMPYGPPAIPGLAQRQQQAALEGVFAQGILSAPGLVSREVAMGLDTAVLHYGRAAGPAASPPVDAAVVSVGPAVGPFEATSPFTPSRERRLSDSHAEPQTPPSQQYTITSLDHLSLTGDPKDQRRTAAGEWPFFQTPQLHRVPFATLDLDSYEDRNNALMQLQAFDPADKENAPVFPNLPEFREKRLPRKAFASPAAVGLASPSGRMFLSPGSYRDARHTSIEFTAAVKEWLLRKFVPRPSAAKPRPYRAVDLAIGRGGDLAQWDKAHCAYLVGVTSSPASVEECRNKLLGRDTEMEADFVCLDVTAEDFGLPEKLQAATFEVVAMFHCLERVFDTEGRARRAIATAAQLLKRGGHLLVLTNDAEVIQRRIAQHGPRFENGAFRFAFHGDTKQLSRGAFGLEYVLDCEESAGPRTYIVPRDMVQALCREAGLEPLPQDHGMFNFEDVASYIEKSASKGHLWRDLPLEDRELVAFWATMVFQKAA